MSATSRGHGRERDWVQVQLAAGRFACRPRWAVVDVLSMKEGQLTFFDEVKSDKDSPYENFRKAQRRKLLETAAKAGAQARLVWWPLAEEKARIIPPEEWPDRFRMVTNEQLAEGYPCREDTVPNFTGAPLPIPTPTFSRAEYVLVRRLADGQCLVLEP